MMQAVDDTRLYNGQFSPDGTLYYEASQALLDSYNAST